MVLFTVQGTEKSKDVIFHEKKAMTEKNTPKKMKAAELSSTINHLTTCQIYLATLCRAPDP